MRFKCLGVRHKSGAVCTPPVMLGFSRLADISANPPLPLAHPMRFAKASRAIRYAWNRASRATNNVHVSDELMAELRSKATAEGKTVDQPAEEAMRKGLEERSWQQLLEYGRQTGCASGYAEADVPDIVKNRRGTNAQRR